MTFPRGQLKSSARPLGAAIGSPLVSTRVAVVSTAGAARAAPISSSGAARTAVSGSTGPAEGRAAGPPGLARRLRGDIDRHRQCHRHAAVVDGALDLALHIVRELARAELGEIDAVAGAQAANLAFVVRPLRRVPAGLVDEAVPDIDIGDARLLGAAAVELVEVGRIGAGLGTALRRQAHPDDRDARALERGDGGIDALDIGELPLLGVEFPRTVIGLPRLLRRHVGGLFDGRGLLGRLLLGVGRRRRRRGRRRGRIRLGRLRAGLRCGRAGRPRTTGAFSRMV